MRKAVKAVKLLRQVYGDVPESRMRPLQLLWRWEHRALNGKLEIKGPLGKPGGLYYKVVEISE